MVPRTQTEDENAAKMRRSSSESSFVCVPDDDGPIKDYRDYRVRKSSLIA